MNHFVCFSFPQCSELCGSRDYKFCVIYQYKSLIDDKVNYSNIYCNVKVPFCLYMRHNFNLIRPIAYFMSSADLNTSRRYSENL